MTPLRSHSWLACAVLLACACSSAHADGLADLRASLARLQGTTPRKASVDAHDRRRTGEGKDAEEHQGSVTIVLEDGPRGLQPLYGRDLLARSDAELRAAVKDKKAGKPIEQALGSAGHRGAALARVGGARAVARGRRGRIRELRGAGRRLEPGKAVRRLVFETGIDSVSDSNRKYVREFKSVLTVWIAADGTPVASNRHLDVSGRAFVVVTFEQHDDQSRSFTVVGDRLVAMRDDEKGSAKGAGEGQDYRTERHLQVLP